MTSHKICLGTLTSTAAIMAAITSLAGCSGDDGRPGLACYDTNMNHQCDLRTEDVNGDGDCNNLDCAGEDGVDGRNGVDGRDGVDGQDGVDGADGQDGVSCSTMQDGNCGIVVCGDDTSVVCAPTTVSFPGCTTYQMGECSVIDCGGSTSVICLPTGSTSTGGASGTGGTGGTGGDTSTGGSPSTGGFTSTNPEIPSGAAEVGASPIGGWGYSAVRVFRTDTPAMAELANPEAVCYNFLDCVDEGLYCSSFEYAAQSVWADATLVNYIFDEYVGQYVIMITDCHDGDRITVQSSNPLNGGYYDGERFVGYDEEYGVDPHAYMIEFDIVDDCSVNAPVVMVQTAEDDFAAGLSVTIQNNS
jgi:hypothetical protein